MIVGWYTKKWWLFALSNERKDVGQITVWDSRGRSVWCHAVGRLWIRTSFVPVKWARP
jgi:hypothetical protein